MNTNAPHPKPSKKINRNSYRHLIRQTFEFPRLGFSDKKSELYFHGVRLMDLVEKFGTPMKITFLPKITEQIEKVQHIFKTAMRKHKYKGKYFYCYCTKSSHFRFIMDEVFKNNVHIETSSEFDFDIIDHLFKENQVGKNTFIISNGYKPTEYLQRIVEKNEKGFRNTICVVDNREELDRLEGMVKKPIKIGLRMAIAEHPTSDIYMSRLGIKTSDVMELYNQRILNNPNFKLKMVHFFINKGISDSSYYWSELERHVQTYCDLKEVCPDLDTFNIGGGLKIYEGLAEEINYDYLVEEIVSTIKRICTARNVPEPHIFSEFGAYTVGESGAVIYSVMGQKQQNDFERWYMIDSSFITTLPDTWGTGQKFILLSLNHWDKTYQRVHLGGITCDGVDYYSSEKQQNQIFMPKVDTATEKLYIGFFHTGAYQESLGGYGGIQHCLIPAPKHIVISMKNNKPVYEVFAEEQDSKGMMKILGY